MIQDKKIKYVEWLCEYIELGNNENFTPDPDVLLNKLYGLKQMLLSDEKEENVKDIRICFKCGGKTNTYRHPNAKIWCTECGHVNREEGSRESTHQERLDTYQAALRGDQP